MQPASLGRGCIERVTPSEAGGTASWGLVCCDVRFREKDVCGREGSGREAGL